MNQEGFHGETIFREKTDNQGEACGGRALRARRRTGGASPDGCFSDFGAGMGVVVGGHGEGRVGRESALHLESGGWL